MTRQRLCLCFEINNHLVKLLANALLIFLQSTHNHEAPWRDAFDLKKLFCSWYTLQPVLVSQRESLAPETPVLLLWRSFKFKISSIYHIPNVWQSYFFFPCLSQNMLVCTHEYGLSAPFELYQPSRECDPTQLLSDIEFCCRSIQPHDWKCALKRDWSIYANVFLDTDIKVFQAPGSDILGQNRYLEKL